MKNLLPITLFLSLLMTSITLFSQKTAMDFEQDECGGNSHHLFAQLEAGNAVILEFVMMNCAPCIVGTNALESITAPYGITHPGRVHIYSFGFLNSYTCEQILAWKANNEYTHPVFNNGEEQVNYYGGMGMPTIVVVGTNEHKVFFKSIGYSTAIDDEIREAIDSALLYNPTGVDEPVPMSGFNIYPTLFTNNINVEIDKDYAGAELVIYDAFGRQVLISRVPECGRQSIQAASLSKGLYIARLKYNNRLSGGIKLIRH